MLSVDSKNHIGMSCSGGNFESVMWFHGFFGSMLAHGALVDCTMPILTSDGGGLSIAKVSKDGDADTVDTHLIMLVTIENGPAMSVDL